MSLRAEFFAPVTDTWPLKRAGPLMRSADELSATHHPHAYRYEYLSGLILVARIGSPHG